MLWIVAAPGPSLTPELAEQTHGYNVVAVNDSYRLLPHATVLYAADADWWRVHGGVPNFHGEKLTTWGKDTKSVASQFRLNAIESARFEKGFSFKPGLIHRGQNNSGFQAVNVALLRGANPVVMIGFDMHGTHFFGEHEPPLRRWDRQRQARNYARWIEGFNKAKDLLPPHIRIINATPGSALKCFPIMTLQEALNAENRRNEVEGINRAQHLSA